MLWKIVTVSLCAALLCCVTGSASGAQNMVGRQSQNEGIPAVPAPGEVVIDGDLSDWDFSGRIWVFADASVRSRYSVEAAAMWDGKNLYLAAKWRDPTPMFSTIDPEFNQNEGWKSDSWQMRFRTDKISHLTTWHFEPKQMPVLHAQYGQSMTQPFGGPGTFVVYAENDTKLGRGIEMAYKMDEDGRGYVQEIKLPWNIIWEEIPEIKAGLEFQLGNEFLWGDPTGRTWPVHRYADNMQPGVLSREFYWTNWRGWGNLTLKADNNLPVRQYVSDEGRIEGTVPVRASVPADAARFTIAINNAEGIRVRNLAGDLLPEDYTVEVKDGVRVVEVMWDCLDDNGKMVPAGRYDAIGLTHEGLGAEYEMCFYNPGTPPWGTQDGTGAWGADHSPPGGVTAGGDWMFVTWRVAEGGQGIIGIDSDGNKKWGERRGINVAAADEEYAYAYVAHWYVNNAICRFDKKTGIYKPFMLNGEPRQFDLPVSDIFGGDAPGTVVGMDVHGDNLVIALTGDTIAVLDRNSAEVKKRIEVKSPGSLAFSRDGILYGNIGGAINRISLETGALTAIPTPGVGRIGSLAIDNDGNIAVADIGPDSQVKVFSPAGELLYTAGKKGGRPIRGDFDEQAMMRVSSIAVDHTGNIWAVESWNYPRRVSVWGRDGRLVRDYIGNTGYAGTGCLLHDDDETLGYVGPVEVKLDRENNTWSVSRILWVPGEGEHFQISTSNHAHPQRFRSDASGQMREYMFVIPYRHTTEPYVILMEDADGSWRPVAAVGLVGQLSGQIDAHGNVHEAPSGQFEGLNADDGFFWNDLNGDGKVQRDECIIIPTNNPAAIGRRLQPALSLGSGWGGRIGKNMAFYTDGITEYKPLRFTEAGAPVYGPEGMRRVVNHGRGDFVPVSEENILLNLSFQGYAGPTPGVMAVDVVKNKILWTYPNRFPGVHGSHRAPMAQPGLIIGPLKICGVAFVNEEVGRVFQMRGNLGQDFLMTTDGLYVGAMFQDGRLPSESLPPREEMLRGVPMEGFSVGGEPFNGWFGRHPDGKIRTLLGIPRQAAMSVEIRGLETIKRFSVPTITINQATLVQAEQDNADRAAAAAEPKKYTIKKMNQPVRADGNPAEWADIEVLAVERRGLPEKASVKIAYDEENLYVLFNVTDASPWRNEGRDYMRLFKTGDAVDLHLGLNPDAPADRRNPVLGDIRILMAPFGGKPAAVLMKPVAPGSPADRKVTYTSPVGNRVFDYVGVMEQARVGVRTEGGRYTVEAIIPLSAIGFQPKPGMIIRGDVGFISSDAQGMENVARTYWSNQHTNLVNDLPQEAWLYPAAWSEFVIE